MPGKPREVDTAPQGAPWNNEKGDKHREQQGKHRRRGNGAIPRKNG